MHLFRVTLEVLHCSVFSNSRIGNSFRYWWRHVTLSHRKPLFVTFNWFSVPDRLFCPFQRAPSDRSRDYLATATETHRSRSCPWYHCFIFMVLGSTPEFLGSLLAFSGFMISSSSSRLVLCRENAKASYK